MDDRTGSPSSASVAVRRIHRRDAEEDGGDPAAARTGESCESCTAVVIADCVAVCCCPCGVVNILALALLKLPWTVARKCLGGGRKRRLRRRGTADGIGDSEMEAPPIGGGNGDLELVNDEFRAEDAWLEVCEVGHLGFGRISFTGLPPFQDRGN